MVCIFATAPTDQSSHCKDFLSWPEHICKNALSEIHKYRNNISAKIALYQVFWNTQILKQHNIKLHIEVFFFWNTHTHEFIGQQFDIIMAWRDLQWLTSKFWTWWSSSLSNLSVTLPAEVKLTQQISVVV